jgi:hypothetical protein
MDTSETYIKMCRKATEIPKGHVLDDNDYYGIGNAVDYYYSGCEEQWSPEFKSTFVWLPRQDQLQEMVLLKDRPVYHILDDFCRFVQSLGKTMFSAWASFEQLWLAFVMREKFNKTWNGDEWVVQ